VNNKQFNRRDILLMTSGAAALCLGRLADGVTPSAASGSSDGLRRAVTRLDLVPEAFGAWSSEPGTISDREQRAASIHGYVRRDYQNADSGYRIGMTLLCGPAGPMAVHPPTACFEGVGYIPLSGPVIASVSSETTGPNATDLESVIHQDEFNKSTFRQDHSTISQTVRVFWGWSSTGSWKAPSRPRVEFRGQPWLYKLYVTDHSTRRPGVAVIPQAESFLKEALPVFRAILADIQLTTEPFSNSPTA